MAVPPGEAAFGVCLKADSQETADGSRALPGSERVPPACTAQVTPSVWVSLLVSFPLHPPKAEAQSAGRRPGPAGRQTSSSPWAGRGDEAAGLAASDSAVGPDVAPGSSF